MDLALLEQFLRVVECGSINRAAQRLGQSQPVVSRAMDELERSLATQLMVRRRSGILLTEAGRALASRAGDLLRHAASVREEVSEESPSRITISLPTPLRYSVTIPLVKKLQRIAPSIQIRVFEGFNAYTRDLLLRGLADIGILGEMQVPESSYEIKPLVQESLRLFRNKDLPKPPSPAPLEELKRYPIAAPGRPNVVRLAVEKAMAERNWSLNISLEAENMDLLHELIRAGCAPQVTGVGMPHPDPNELGMWSAAIEGLALTWVIAVNRQRSHNVAIRTVTRALTETVREAIETGLWPEAKLL